jgi:hypothetical protein
LERNAVLSVLENMISKDHQLMLPFLIPLDGEGVVERLEVDGDFVGEEIDDAGEGSGEVGFVGSSPELLEESFGEEEGDEFAFGELEEGELESGVGVAVAVFHAAEVERGAELVAHELDVSLDGASVDFEFDREGFGVGEFADPDAMIDDLNAFKRRPRNPLLHDGRPFVVRGFHDPP